MPRDGAGVYSLPNGSTATPNTPVLASQHNTPLADIAVEMTASLPRSGAAPMLGDLTLLRDPISALHAATKQYVDNLSAGLDIKPSVKCATTANIAVTGEQTLDGVLTANSRVLIKNQTAPAQNGIYISATGAWSRVGDMDAWSEVPGASVWVEQGTTQGDTGWVCTADQGGTLGTTAITWQQFGGSGAFQAASVLLSSLAALAIVAGDLIYGSGANAVARLAKGEAGQSLMQGATLPAWGLPMGHLGGMVLARVDATHFSVAAGVAAGDNQGAITLGAAISKSLSAWAAGNNNGGLDTGAVAANTWYHVHAIRKDSDGSADALYSLSPTAPTMPGGYTARRRVGSIRTDGSSQITDFEQKGDYFFWKTPVLDADTTSFAVGSRVLRTLSVPTGLKIRALLRLAQFTGGGTWMGAIYSPDENDPAAEMTYNSASAAIWVPEFFAYNANTWAFGRTDVWTNASGQVATYFTGTVSTGRSAIQTDGWMDLRGR